MSENDIESQPSDLDRALTAAERDVWASLLNSAQQIKPSVEFGNALEQRLIEIEIAQSDTRSLRRNALARPPAAPAQPMKRTGSLALRLRRSWAPVLIGLGLAASILIVLFASISSHENDKALITATEDPYSILRKAAQANLAIPAGKVRHMVYETQRIGDPRAGLYPPTPWRDESWLAPNGKGSYLMREEDDDIGYLGLMDSQYYWMKDPYKDKTSVDRYPASPGIATSFALDLNPIRLMLSLPDLRVAGPDKVNGRSTILIDRITVKPAPGILTEEIMDFRLWLDPQTLEVVQFQDLFRQVADGAFTGKEWTSTSTLLLDEVQDRGEFAADLFTFQVPEGMKVNSNPQMVLGHDPISGFAETPLATGPSPSPTAGSQDTPVTPTPEAAVPRMPLNQFKVMYDNPSTRPLIIDVRPADAFSNGHIAGAVSIPEAEIDARAADLPMDKLVVLYDDSPAEAAATRVAAKLHSQYLFDYEWLKVLAGGWNAWKQAGTNDSAAYPVATGPAPFVGTQDAWASLRARPVNLPSMGQDGGCPVSQGKAAIAGLPPLLGKGPIYPAGIYSGDGTTFYLPPAPDEKGLFDSKIVWVGDPSYNGDPVLVRGVEINGPDKILFQFSADAPIKNELLLDGDNGSQSSSSPSGWYNWPTSLYLSGPGCYTLQVDSDGFSETIVFKASPAQMQTPGWP